MPAILRPVSADVRKNSIFRPCFDPAPHAQAMLRMVLARRFMHI